MLHDHPYRARTGSEIHGAAHQRSLVREPHVPVGEIAIGRDLERAKNGYVDMTTADHGERPGGIDDRCAWPDGNAPAAGIDQVSVDTLGRCQQTDTDHAVLGLDENVDVRADVVG